MTSNMSLLELFEVTAKASGRSMALLEDVFKYWEVNNIGDAMEQAEKKLKEENKSIDNT